jgi:hypothetical protein
MEELIDLIATQQPASEISDRIKNILFAKASEKIDSIRPEVAASMFGDENQGHSEEQE